MVLALTNTKIVTQRICQMLRRDVKELAMATQEQSREWQGKFVTSSDEEHFDCSEFFDTKEGAISYGRQEDHRFVGVIDVPNPINGVDEDALLEQITSDDCYAGDHWEGFLRSGEVSDDEFVDLRKRLQYALENWLEAHSLWPGRCNVINIESIPSLQAEGGAV
jgi:hypothetical protein